MTIEYRLKGYGCGPAHRYVEVVTLDKDGSMTRIQTLELPEGEAVHLCASMATDSTLQRIVDSAIADREEPVGNWFNSDGGCLLPGIMQLIARAAHRRTLWLGDISLKYIGIRVDMRTGDFLITDSRNAEAHERVFKILDWPKLLQKQIK